MSATRMSKLERGVARLEVVELMAFAQELGVSVDYLLAKTRERKPPDERLRSRILEAEQELPDELRVLLAAFLETLLRTNAQLRELATASRAAVVQPKRRRKTRRKPRHIVRRQGRR